MNMDSGSELTLLYDVEPIDFLSQIQPIGALIVVSCDDLKILQVSEKVEDYIGITKESLLLKSIYDCFNLSFIEELTFNIGELKRVQKNFTTIQCNVNNKELFCVINIKCEYVILEMSNLLSKEDVASEQLVSKVLDKSKELDSFDSLINFIVQSVQEISGFDRVLLYKFYEERNDIVLAQSFNVSKENIIGNFVTAPNIPQESKTLYIKNKFLIIEDLFANTLNIHPILNPLTLKPLDMSCCYFKSVPPIHIEYLKNIGVTSSLSISIVVDDKLWGVVACHHYESKKIPLTSYETYSILSSIFSLLVAQKEKIVKYKKEFELNLRRELFFNSLNLSANLTFSQAINQNISKLINIVNCDYCILVYEDIVYFEGKNITDKDLKSLVNLASKNINEDIFYTNQLGLEYPEIKLQNISIDRFLAVKIQALDNSYLLFLRAKEIRETKIADEESIEFRDNQIVIDNRASFENMNQITFGTSLSFSEVEIKNAKLLSKELQISYEYFIGYEETRSLKKQQKMQEQILIQNSIEKKVFLEREQLFNSIGEGFYGVDLNMNCFFINSVALEILSLREDEILGKNIHKIIHHHPLDKGVYDQHECIICNTILYEIKNEQNDWLFKSNGDKFPVKIIATPVYDENILVGVAVAFSDISRQYYAEQDLQILNQKLRIQSTTDPLTQLYNQRYFRECGLLQFELAKKNKTEISLITVGINSFSNIKTIYGNDISDAILVMVANILKSKIRNQDDVVTRTGCEEFTIIAPYLSSIEVLKMSEEINEEIKNQSILLNGINVFCSASVSAIAYESNLFLNFSDFVRASELKSILLKNDNGRD